MRTLIIPAAGLGTRFRELGRYYPKCLLPCEGVPLLLRSLINLRTARAIGPDDAVFVTVPADWETSPAADLWRLVQGHGVILVPVDRTLPQGPATSIYCALHAAEPECPVLVVLSDMEVTATGAAELDPGDWVSVSTVTNGSRWCVAARDRAGFVTALEDKPVGRDGEPALALTGVYSFRDGPAVLEAFAHAALLSPVGAEPQISTALERYAAATGNRFCAHELPHDALVDYGTLEEYVRNNAAFCRPREFNELIVTPTTVTKRGRDRVKLLAEATWMAFLPEEMRHRVPAVRRVDLVTGSFEMERLYGHNLRSLALYYDRSYSLWTAIFQDLFEFMKDCAVRAVPMQRSSFRDEVVLRTNQRVAAYDRTLTHEALWAAHEMPKLLDPAVFPRDTLYHGDLHFGNLLWSNESRVTRMVDPRGGVGHWLYDVAKLAHSVHGRYDYIEEGLYTLDEDGSARFYDAGRGEIQRAFQEVILSQLSEAQLRAVRALTCSLFLSMRPLHADNPVHQRLFSEEFLRLRNLYQI